MFKSIKTLKRNFSVKLPNCDFTPKKYNGISYEKIKEIRSKNVHPALKTFYKSPIALHQGHKQYLWDINGKRYLDMFAGICTVSVGHSHPKISAAIAEQVSTLSHVSNIYLFPEIHEYCEKLAQKFPKDLNTVFLVNSGSEANDLAILMSRAFTKRSEVLSLRNCYHGMSGLVMGMTASPVYKHAMPQAPGMHHVMNPDVFKGLFGGKSCRDSLSQPERQCDCQASCHAKDEYLAQFEDTIKYSINKKNICAFFAEPMQGVGGIVQYPKGFLKEVSERIKTYGGLYVSDEVQTGFGRTGEHYWGFEMHGVTPDIVTMAKGIGNGFPLGAVVTRREIADALAESAFFNTFGGNPVACTVGKTVLEIIDEEKLQENCKITGGHLINGLVKLKSEFDIVGDVRGKGLMIGVELVKPGTTQPLEADKFEKIFEKTKDLGLLIGRGGADGNVLRIQPPMCVTKEDADFTVDVLREAFSCK